MEKKQLLKTLANISPIKSNVCSLGSEHGNSIAAYFSITQDIPYEPNRDFRATNPRPGLSFQFREIREVEVEDCLATFPLNSAPGPDGIEVPMLSTQSSYQKLLDYSMKPSRHPHSLLI